MARTSKLLLSLLGLFLFATTPAQSAAPSDTADSFRLLASELVIDLDRVAAARGQGAALTVAVWPHPPGRTPVPAPLAEEYNDRLLAALLEAGGHRHRFVARDSLRAVVLDIAESSDLSENLDQVLAALAERAQADVLVVCKLRAVGEDAVQISYRAVDVSDGAILAATSHRRLAVLPAEVTAAATALTLEQALTEATDTLVRRAPDLQELRLTGLRYADSGQETPFGRYLEGRLADALVEAYENPLTGRSILLRQSAATKEGPDLPYPPATADLSGRYWDFGEVVEVRLSLQDGHGVAAVWRGRIASKSLPPNLRRQPQAPVAKRSTPAPRAAPPRPTVSAALIRRSQRNLQQLGYRPGPVDGLVGPRTRAAIRRYQVSQGLPVDGMLTADLAERLDLSSAQAMARSEVQVSKTPRSRHTVTVAPVSNGAAVGSNGVYCREYAQSVTIGGKRQPSYGTVCRQPDGSWKFARQ